MCHQAGFSPKIRYEPELMTTVFVLVECGLGVSLVPGNVCRFERQTTIRRPLAVRSNPMPLCAAWPRGSHSPTREAFLDIMRAQKPLIQKTIADSYQGVTCRFVKVGSAGLTTSRHRGGKLLSGTVGR